MDSSNDELYRTGLKYLRGDILPLNKPIGIQILKDAANCGNQEAALTLAQCYADGDGVERDMEQSNFYLALFKKSVKKARSPPKIELPSNSPRPVAIEVTTISKPGNLFTDRPVNVPYDTPIQLDSIQQLPNSFESCEDYADRMLAFVELEKRTHLQSTGLEYFTFNNVTWSDECNFCIHDISSLFTFEIFKNSVIRVRVGQTIEEASAIKNKKTKSLLITFGTPSAFYGMTSLEIAHYRMPVSFDRQAEALIHFKENSHLYNEGIVAGILGQKAILDKNNLLPSEGHDLRPRQPKACNFNLNKPQIIAIKKALKSRFITIQGPPGTGKTTVIGILIYSLLRAQCTPILVCTQSNVAADFVTLQIHKNSINVVRVESVDSGCAFDEVAPLCLGNLVEAKYGKQLNPGQRYKYERELLKDTPVICTTCVKSGDKKFQGMSFHSLIIDEAGQCLDPDILIPLRHNIQQLILVGDHQQLGPIAMAKESAELGYQRSMIARLCCVDINPLALLYQFRMHPAICDFPNKYFYREQLKTPENTPQSEVSPVFPWPNPEKPVVFWPCYGTEQKDVDNRSVSNIGEIQIISEIIDHLISNGVEPENIGVITLYSAQEKLLQKRLPEVCKYATEAIISRITLKSVDGFQGNEKDFIILSTVRSNCINTIGFLRDPRRLCVSLTRSKKGLFVIGNPDTLSVDELWCSYVTYCREQGLFLE